MKILFQSRVDLYNPRGGDTLQMENTKLAIEKLNPSIKIDIRPEIKVKDINSYDIVHLFNLDWVSETYIQAKWAKSHNVPIVLSAIHHAEDEVKIFEKYARYDVRRVYNAIFSNQSLRDFGKNIYRSFFNYKKVSPTIVQGLIGIRKEQKEILKMCDVVLVQTEKEAEDIAKDFKFKKFKWEKVVNGVNTDIFGKTSGSHFDKLFKEVFNEDLLNFKVILNVGRIEPRKNQLNLIKAFENLKNDALFDDYGLIFKDYLLIFIGAYTERSYEYVYRFKKAIKNNSNIYHFDAVSPEIVASAMNRDGVYAHPSWFETTGLVCIEAAMAGMQLVATGDRVKEYLGDSAYYCDPKDVKSIQDAILKSVKSPKNISRLQKNIEDKYTWNKTAKQTISVYEKILRKH